VGVIHPDGAEADFWSTTLFVWGVRRALAFMRGGGRAILLDNEDTLYVSQGLADGFELHDEEGRYNLVFVPGPGAAA
jgi:thiamine biosynthesis lipoprotein ApbE